MVDRTCCRADDGKKISRANVEPSMRTKIRRRMTDFSNIASKITELSKPDRDDTCSQSSIQTCRIAKVHETRASRADAP